LPVHQRLLRALGALGVFVGLALATARGTKGGDHASRTQATPSQYWTLLVRRDNVLERLESYQRDLEQELADVSDLIERLRAGQTETQAQSV
jgi:hypothetical protein